MYKYFKEEEVRGLNIKLIQMLDRARELAEIPFRLTSTLRDEKHNIEVGGVSDSSHLKGLAVDISCETDLNRFKIITALLLVGFKRLGIYQHHIHADIDATKSQNIIFRG